MVKPDGSPEEDSSPGSSQAPAAAKGYAHLLKIILLGDSGTGKTALLRRHVEDVFEDKRLPTIGVDFGVKSMEMPNQDMVKLQVWDTAGQERYRNITTSYYRGAQAVLIVYDVTNKESRENVKKWIQEVRIYGADDVIMVVVGTKVDLKEISPEFYSTEDLKSELEADGEDIESFFEVSSKTGEGVERVFRSVTDTFVTRRLQDRNTLRGAMKKIDKKSDVISVAKTPVERKKKCC